MPMIREDLLNAIIDDGVYEITTTYLRPDQRMKREGGIAGFEACRGLSDEGILELAERASARTASARHRQASDYWYHRVYEVQVLWVLNVLSAALLANDMRPLTEVTEKGVLKAADILGVADRP